jgi:6-pyruvoyltetrahydropterin/6-carboxytetrahydropterin synthase
LADKFGAAKVSELSLALNPFRKVTVDCEDSEMIYFSEKFEFAATHKLWNDSFSDERNFEVFGKCANPAGHGHNYIVEVTVKKTVKKGELRIGDFERLVDKEFIKVVDHKNLNVDVPYFAEAIPTVENIARFAWERIVGKFGEAGLHCVTIWETDKTCCSYYGQ